MPSRNEILNATKANSLKDDDLLVITRQNDEGNAPFRTITAGDLANEITLNQRGKLQCVGLGGRINCGLNGGAGDGNRTVIETQRHYPIAGRGGLVGGIRPLMVNFVLTPSGVVDNGNAIRIAASAIFPLDGSNYRKYTFFGDDYGRIAKGGLALPDYGFDANIVANASVRMRFAAEVVTAGYTIGGTGFLASSTDISITHTDSIIPLNDASDCRGRVHSSTTFTGYAPANIATSQFSLGAACIVGYSERPQVAILTIGDSNATGQGDNALGDGQGANGFIERGLRTTASGVTAGTLWSCPGISLGLTYDKYWTNKLFEVMEYHTHFLQQVSGNSIGNGESLANMKRWTVNAWQAAKIRNLKTIQLSSLPRTNAGNTAVATNFGVGGLRDQYNAWAASVVGQKIDANGDLSSSGTVYLDYYWDILSVVQDPTTNLWLFSSYTSDGTHLSAIGHALVAIIIASLANALTTF